MNSEHGKYISSLKSIASLEEWDLARVSLSNLALLLNPRDVIDIINFLVREFLRVDTNNGTPIRSYYSTSSWDDINDLDSLRRAAADIKIKLKDRARTPGINNFRGAMTEIQQMTRYKPNSQDDAEIFVDAVCGIIMAILDRVWGGNNPDLWLRAFKHKTKQDFFIRANHFARDQDVLVKNKIIWSQVGDIIGQKLADS